MCQNSYFLCLQGIRMHRSTREEQKNVLSAKKKIKQPENKFTALSKILLCLKMISSFFPSLMFC